MCLETIFLVHQTGPHFVFIKNSKYPEDGQKILPRIFPNECQLPNISQLPHPIEGRIMYMTLYQRVHSQRVMEDLPPSHTPKLLEFISLIANQDVQRLGILSEGPQGKPLLSTTLPIPWLRLCSYLGQYSHCTWEYSCCFKLQPKSISPTFKKSSVYIRGKQKTP